MQESRGVDEFDDGDAELVVEARVGDDADGVLVWGGLAVALECELAVEEVDEFGAGGPAWNVRSSGTWKRRQQVTEGELAERIPCQDETNFRDIKCGIWDLCPAGLSLLLMEAIS